uniref:F-box domain-containing protein n=1 Tax=Branchiostoma floridae TaxID=7739 RepID=C3Y8Y8_BRAFL|eukprot:XP_002607034.1 hypothetical protein BRAFLDRAFT_127069 [Branchiostoma floridae]
MGARLRRITMNYMCRAPIIDAAPREMTTYESFMWRNAVQSSGLYRLRRGESSRDGRGWWWSPSENACVHCCRSLCALLGRWAMEKTTTDNNPTSPVNGGISNGVPAKDMKDANANTTAKSRLPRSKRMPLLKDGLRTGKEGGGVSTTTSSAEHRALFDEKILSRLFTYFWPCERCVLAQVCSKWKQVLYQPKFWREVTPILHCRELYTEGTDGEKRFVDLTSFQQRGFESACLVGVADLDICEFIDNYPPSKKTIKYISLKRSTVTDAGCVRITDTGLGFLSTMTSLTALYLRWCCQVQDFGLQHIYSMKKLRVLSLAGCPLLTPAGLSGLVQLKNLEELELTNCPGTTPELFQYYAQHLPRCMVIE